jgi:hypothetical protein
MCKVGAADGRDFRAPSLAVPADPHEPARSQCRRRDPVFVRLHHTDGHPRQSTEGQPAGCVQHRRDRIAVLSLTRVSTAQLPSKTYMLVNLVDISRVLDEYAHIST